ncbi:MAG: PIN domain-containing protein, partial [Anaerobacillus sp.]
MLLKTFVLDTNILLHDAHSLFQFGDNHVVVPAIVIEEIDSKKRLMNEVGRNA